MRFRPITPQLLVAELTETVAALDGRVRVAVDGAPEAEPGLLADSLVEPLRVLGRPTLRVSAADFLRPASVRLERGRFDPDAFYEDWLDLGALRREVLDPMRESGKVLPALWDAAADRATRSSYVDVAENAILLLDGTLLLGTGLPFEHTVHVALSDGALSRRIDESRRWRLPAYRRYATEVDPLHIAGTAVRADDPTKPAIRT